MLPQRFDNNEYELLSHIETKVRLVQDVCSEDARVKSALRPLVYDVELLYTYALYTPNNPEVFEVAKILRDDVKEMQGRYERGDASATYCNLKTRAMRIKTSAILNAVGKKPRE